MNLRARIEELERKFPSIREMEAECVYPDGHVEWLTLDAMKRDLDVITFNRFRNCSLPGLDKWLQYMKESAQ